MQKIILSRKLKILIIIIILLATLGLADSAYLFWTEQKGGEVVCTTGGCSFVLSSPYSYLLGIKLPVWGMLYYLSLLLLAVLVITKKYKAATRVLAATSLSGFLMSLYFTYIQFYELVALCQWCLFSAFSSTLIFILTSTLYLKTRTQKPPYSQKEDDKQL